MPPGIVFLIPITFMVCVAATVLGVTWIRARSRDNERLHMGGGVGPEISSRMERMEQAIDAIAIEVERIAEGQRFVTKLLSERSEVPALGAGEPARSAMRGGEQHR